MMEENRELYIEGIFLEEINPRFKGIVNINGRNEICYISCSTKLSRYIQLTGRTVVLKRNDKQCKTKYTLIGLKVKNKIIILNLNNVNNYFKELYEKDNMVEYNFNTIGKQEIIIDEYNADYYVEEEKMIIENKTVISEEKIAKFPNYVSERALQQMKKLRNLIKKGYNVRYNIFILTPKTKKLELNKKYKDYNNQFIENIKEGMSVGLYYMYFENNILKCTNFLDKELFNNK